MDQQWVSRDGARRDLVGTVFTGKAHCVRGSTSPTTLYAAKVLLFPGRGVLPSRTDDRPSHTMSFSVALPCWLTDSSFAPGQLYAACGSRLGRPKPFDYLAKASTFLRFAATMEEARGSVENPRSSRGPCDFGSVLVVTPFRQLSRHCRVCWTSLTKRPRLRTLERARTVRNVGYVSFRGLVQRWPCWSSADVLLAF